jgi:hypothetical protein
MIASIRFFFVNIFIFAHLAAEAPLVRFNQGEDVHYEAKTSIRSTFEKEGQSSIFLIIEDVTGTLLQEIDHFQFTLHSLNYSINQDKMLSLDHPDGSLELVELQRWKNKPISFVLKKTAPHLEFSKTFLAQYGDLAIFKTPFFAGLLNVEDFLTLFELAHHSLKVGEGFELLFSKTEGTLYEKRQTFALREISEDRLIVEVTTLIDRQKIPLEDGGTLVVFGEFKALWTIQRKAALLFHLEESGTLTHGMKQGGVESKQTYKVKKQIKTNLL